MSEKYPKSCGCAGPEFVSQCNQHQPEVLAGHAQHLGVGRIRIASPSAVCGLIGCQWRELHEHIVLADTAVSRP